MNKNRKKCNKKVLATGGVLLAAAVVAGSLATTSFNKVSKASVPEVSYEEVLPAMEWVAEEFAEDFAEAVETNVDLSASGSVPIYNANDCVVGYSVSLSDANGEYGYVNIDYTNEALVTDFSVTDTSDSIYDALTENFAAADEDVEVEDCEDKLVSVNGMDYAVSAVDGNNQEKFYYNGTTYESEDFEEMLDHYEENYLEYYDNIEYEDNFVDESEFEANKAGIVSKFKNWVSKNYPGVYNKLWAEGQFVAPTAYPTHDEVFKNETICSLDTEVYLPQYSKEKSLLSQEMVMKTTNRYACELVGITAICQQENMSLNGNLKDTFNKLWDLAGCEGRIYETGTFYGNYVVDCSSTYTRQMPSVLEKYGKLFNKKVTGTYKSSPKFEFFKKSIDNGCSTSFGYCVKNEGGHGVNVVGYAEGTFGELDIDYIITGDSWFDDAPRYVLYGKGLFQSVEANSFKVEDM
ncbi:MAG: hypothetical protein E7262_02175 [Lachnospiraceae bacterium]|nr:hypothetical protein [Lachnospiraceae bacterium]